jgi:hypothetical protein
MRGDACVTSCPHLLLTLSHAGPVANKKKEKDNNSMQTSEKQKKNKNQQSNEDEAVEQAARGIMTLDSDVQNSDAWLHRVNKTASPSAGKSVPSAPPQTLATPPPQASAAKKTPPQKAPPANKTPAKMPAKTPAKTPAKMPAKTPGRPFQFVSIWFCHIHCCSHLYVFYHSHSPSLRKC